MASNLDHLPSFIVHRSSLIAQIDPTWMFLAGCVLLTVILLKRSYRYFGGSRRRGSAAAIEKVARPRSTWDGAQRDTLAVVERQKVEMHEMARDLNGQLSSRIVVLEQLIAESGRQIERLEQLLGQAEHAG